MKFFFSCILAMLFVVNHADAQKIYATRNGRISFSALQMKM
jgi:hypothetical protein